MYAGRILATDLYAAVVGQVGGIWTFGQDVWELGTNIAAGNLVGAGRRALMS